MPLPDPRRIETFRVAALCGRVSDAAKRLHLSQPAVTAQIHQLEESMGCRLFLRSRSGILLTPAGRSLMRIAEAMHRLLQETASIAASPELGPLRLGASTTAAAYVLVPPLAAFARQHPGLQVQLEVGNTAQVQDWLRNGNVDLGVVEGLQHAPGLHLETYRADELVCVGPGNPPPGFRIPGSAAELPSHPLIWRESGSGTRAVVARALKRLSPPRVPLPTDPVLGHTETIKAAVQAGMGLAFLPLCAIRGELERGSLRRINLPGLRVQRNFSWVIPPGGMAGSAAHFHRLAHALAGDEEPSHD